MVIKNLPNPCFSYVLNQLNDIGEGLGIELFTKVLSCGGIGSQIIINQEFDVYVAVHLVQELKTIGSVPGRNSKKIQ